MKKVISCKYPIPDKAGVDGSNPSWPTYCLRGSLTLPALHIVKVTGDWTQW